MKYACEKFFTNFVVLRMVFHQEKSSKFKAFSNLCQLKDNDWGDVGETGRRQNAYVFSFVFRAWHIYSRNHVLLKMCYS